MVRFTTHCGWSVMENTNKSYFMRRAAQERSAADHASDRAARHVHLELERRYRELVGTPEEETV
jgi:hypothetical protein